MNWQGDFFNQQFDLGFDDTPVNKKSMLDEVVESILNEIESGPEDRWIMPWSKTHGLPINAYTGKPYNGRNMLLLWASASRNNFRSNRWATFLQWQQMGSPVPQGYRATRVFRPINQAQQNATGGNDTVLTFRPIAVFNADQINHRTEEQRELIPLNPDFDESKARELIGAIDVDIRFQGARAYYKNDDDRVFIPPRASFTGSPTLSADEAYYSTILHELIHWTGHRSRCDRVFGTQRDSVEYAKEELVAEIGAALLCHNLGISPEIRPDHVQYIQSWKKNLTDEPESLVTAAEQAIHAVKFLKQSTAQITLEF